MTPPSVPPFAGADNLVSWFGRWPTFHDAEVLSFHVNRGSVSAIRIHAWNQSDRTNADGTFVREREAIVVFELRGIKELRVEGENADSQNVIAGLSVEQVSGGYRLTLMPCYGLYGEILAEELSTRIESGR